MIIVSSDVTSFYPNLAIRNGWSPAHLPKKEFCTLYEWFFDERKKISKKDIRNYVYKIILNSTYGLSNDETCFLYDPEFTMRIK
jgi:DNA polymerase elongation subunit (family B)